ncbi:MAG TPA: B12-binding domain-containing radical SAM protein [Ruminococcaceae bacterium]|nr:B12-binding domain-containing radical SAM protein [Oscillospiraceae bacterium]
MEQNQMNCLLIAINAKFIHTNLAVRYLKEYAAQQGLKSEFAEFTINNRADYIMNEIYLKKPDMLVFSCYIWNIEIMLDVAREYKKLAPNTVMIFGGPEVSYNSDEFLKKYCFADCVIVGEGEQTFAEILSGKSYAEIYGLTYRLPNGNIKINEPRQPIDMSLLPFAYKEDLSACTEKIIYYESSRGCPFRCSYCLSSIEKGVRYKPLKKVFDELLIFIKNRVRQVKFVDRTFNCSKSHFIPILEFISGNDNGYTNFHFEISADLIDSETLNLLKTMRKGLIQLEIGVQTVNEKTLAEINRTTNLKKLFENVKTIKSFNNIHLHLDLIAGLPFEDYNSFISSFNTVYACRPQQLQLGFLKLLKGSPMLANTQKHGIAYRDKAPYEVLFTSYISYDEMLKLKYVEEMVELYYNSGRFNAVVEYMQQKFSSPFEFFYRLSQFYFGGGYHQRQHSKDAYYTILYDFMLEAFGKIEENFKWLCKFDILCNEKPKKLPEWLNADITADKKYEILDFYSSEDNVKKYLENYIGCEPKWIAKTAHIECFAFNPITGDESAPTVLLFDYSKRDITGRAAVHKIVL